jgi:hypothetical protein
MTEGTTLRGKGVDRSESGNVLLVSKFVSFGGYSDHHRSPEGVAYMMLRGPAVDSNSPVDEKTEAKQTEDLLKALPGIEPGLDLQLLQPTRDKD